MLLFGPNKNGKYEPRYFDEEGYNILDMTSKKLQVKKKGKKYVRVKQDEAEEQKVLTSQEIIIPFTLDVNKPPPPPSAPIHSAYDWWVQKGASMFLHIQITAPPPAVPATAPSASSSIQTPQTTATSEKSKSAPNVVQRDVLPKSHQYSENRLQQKDRSKIPVAR